MEVDYDFVASLFEKYSHESDLISRIEAQISSTKSELAELERLEKSAHSKINELEKLSSENDDFDENDSDGEIGEILTLAKCVRLEQVIQG